VGGRNLGSADAVDLIAVDSRVANRIDTRIEHKA
jgi:hypothetical protein